MMKSGLGHKEIRSGFVGRVKAVFGNSRHNWLWDYESVIPLLYQAGFKNVRRCHFNDSSYKELKLVENADRFENAIAIEAIR